jgi:hypothetical protein
MSPAEISALLVCAAGFMHYAGPLPDPAAVSIVRENLNAPGAIERFHDACAAKGISQAYCRVDGVTDFELDGLHYRWIVRLDPRADPETPLHEAVRVLQRRALLAGIEPWRSAMDWRRREREARTIADRHWQDCPATVAFRPGGIAGRSYARASSAPSMNARRP